MMFVFRRFASFHNKIQMRRNTLLASVNYRVGSTLGLINIFGGAIIGYNSGIVAGMSLPLISCTLFDKSNSINVSLYQGIFTASILVFAAIGSPLGLYMKKVLGMKKVMLHILA